MEQIVGTFYEKHVELYCFHLAELIFDLQSWSIHFDRQAKQNQEYTIFTEFLNSRKQHIKQRKST